MKPEDEGRFELKAVLRRLGISQRKLAKLSGMEVRHISRYANGHYRPNWCAACRMAAALGITVGLFCPDDPAAVEFFKEKEGAA